MPDVDSKVVSAAIRAEIRPLLREQGFSRFTGRSAWRFEAGRVEVVNFQSFNSYNAGGIGCTTYSVAVNLGTYLTSVPDLWGRLKRDGHGLLLPQEYECHYRAPLQRALRQPELTRRDIWFIDPEGRYLPKAMHDVRMALLSRGAEWFARLRDDAEVLRILREEREDEQLWGFGNKPSPIRHFLSGYVALAVGELEFARASLQAAGESASFGAKRDVFEAALRTAG
jgi:hypothetical protein